MLCTIVLLITTLISKVAYAATHIALRLIRSCAIIKICMTSTTIIKATMSTLYIIKLPILLLIVWPSIIIILKITPIIVILASTTTSHLTKFHWHYITVTVQVIIILT